MKTNRLIIAILLAAVSARAKHYHVAKGGNNRDDGSQARPFLTIQHAADLAQPGDVISVHEGVYRERVNPPRGGESDEYRIVYQAAPGEGVVIKGSEVVKGWHRVQGGVWRVVLDNGFFGELNPYSDVIGGEWYRTPAGGFDRHTGAVYLNGDWLDEARSLVELLPSPRSPVDSKDVVLGGKIATYPGRAIAGTEEDVLYQTCRYDLGGYRLGVPKGIYRVSLKFCEPHFDSRAKRVFDVKLQGRTVLRDFDIFARVGKFAAHDEVFDGIEVADGHLGIEIVNRVSLACISAIVIEGGKLSRKINCGGSAWNSFQPDPRSSRHGGAPAAGRLWKAEVDEENTTIWGRFDDVNPNEETVEINVRQSIFYPDRPGRNYITVRGFTMRHAATPWSGAMSEQIGLVGTHWSRCWIIENNVISHSMNTGITLGRYDLEGRHGVPLPPATAPGFVRSCELAIENGWSRENIGSHIVRNNHISHCEKNGIHGSLGGIFSTIEGNTICDIATRGWIGGPDVAGLKLLGSQDVIIRGNHIHRCGAVGGIWLDWMAQGTRVTRNLLHNNSGDLFMEVNHGPFLIDNNLFLSGKAIRDWSQGAAYVHNLFAGTISAKPQERKTPYFKPHAVEDMKLSDIQHKDARYYNNVFVGECRPPAGITAADLQSAGNAYLEGPGVEVEERADGVWLRFSQSAADATGDCRLITTELLGRAETPGAPFEQPDGTPYRIDTDYFGKRRRDVSPAPGPFCRQSKGAIELKVWGDEQSEQRTGKPAKPNIILFISDDHGWADSGAYGDGYIQTPNIDRLSGQGMRFDCAFAASPLCSPSRCVIQTGLMPHRNGGHKFNTPVNVGIKTMAAHFNEMGYATAHFGKFHTAPRNQFPYSHINRSRKTPPAVEFLSNYNGDKPLFLVVCSYPPHTPWVKNTMYDPARIKLPPNFVDTPETRSDRANYYSDVALMDSFLGEILDVVEKREDMDENTLVIYTSDQGANWPFAKWCVYDQGLRVPFIARWPGKIAPGSTTDAMINLADLLPTCIEAAGGAPPTDLDGRSIVPVLLGEKSEHRKRVFGTHTGNDNGGPGTANHCPARTVRDRRFRYILNLDPKTTFTTHITGQKAGPHYLPHWDSWLEKASVDEKAQRLVHVYQHRPAEELYDLARDPYEMSNLAGNPEYSQILRDLRTALSEWRRSQDDFEESYE